MRNNLRQLPDLTFSRTLAVVLRGWYLTIERNEQLTALVTISQSLVFVTVGHNILRKFCNSSVALPTSQLILQPFRFFSYVTVHSPTLISLLLRHRLFTYVTWQTAHGDMDSKE